MRKRLLLALALSLPLPSGTVAGAAEVAQVSLCDVMAKPTGFYERYITLRAKVISDGIHSTLLIDRSCDGGIGLITEDATNRPDLAALNKAIWDGTPPGTSNKFISGTFSGVVRPGRNNHINMHVDKVADLAVSQYPTP